MNMTEIELANKLNDMYFNAEKGEKVLMIHLFGIKYAEEILENRISTKEIAKAANINESYGTEISKGVKLSKYVIIK
jgi:hypothetical protein